MDTLESTKDQSWLLWFLKGLLILGFLILIGRLFELTIIKGDYYRALAEDNRIRSINIPAPRGKIYDRTGEIVVTNKEIQKQIVFDPQEGYIKQDLDQATSSEILLTEYQRVYPHGPNTAHTTGYLGETTQEEVSTIHPDCPQKGILKLGALIGRAGLEQYYDCKLRGTDGQLLIEVDTSGRSVRVLGQKDPIPGEDLHTNIDLSLQNKLVSIIESQETQKGATIVTDSAGQVLALYSYPSFNPLKVEDSVNDDTLPLFNRALAGSFHPGSVFKPVTAIAALEEGNINKDYTFLDKGFIKVDEYEYTNWYYTQYGRTEGEIDLPKALARSTDTFFYRIGELVGANTLSNWAGRFALDQKTNIDLPGEIQSLVPSPRWKRKTLRQAWFLGNTYHMAIGQGDMNLTPAAVIRMISAIATNGNLCELKIVGEPSCNKLRVKQDNLNLVKEGLIAACATGGTAFPFFDFNTDDDPETPDVACKTGTAETYKEDITHAWFVAFSPVNNPELAITTLVEEGGEGSRDAAPIARELFDFYFNP